jgi:hypothetical protein
LLLLKTQGVVKHPVRFGSRKVMLVLDFFHLKANGRTRKKLIPCLKNEARGYVWSHEEKAAILQEYFQSILGTHEHRSTTINWDDIQLPQLPDQSQLDRQFTEEEIRLAVADLPVEKAPWA